VFSPRQRSHGVSFRRDRRRRTESRRATMLRSSGGSRSTSPTPFRTSPSASASAPRCLCAPAPATTRAGARGAGPAAVVRTRCARSLLRPEGVRCLRAARGGRRRTSCRRIRSRSVRTTLCSSSSGAHSTSRRARARRAPPWRASANRRSTPASTRSSPMTRQARGPRALGRRPPVPGCHAGTALRVPLESLYRAPCSDETCPVSTG
jgi:hypothetical protein